MRDKQVRLTRVVSFSSGHRYWLDSKSEAENRALFGKWASPYNHGHNYKLEVTTLGPVRQDTGMVVNIKDIDDVLQELVVDRFDQKSLNDELTEFRDRSTSVESILGVLKNILQQALPAELVSLKLEEMPLLYGELAKASESWKMTLTRVYEFCASHRLHSPSLSDAENLRLFGKCNNPAGHGHNYVLEVTVTGEPHPETGMIADIGAIDSKVGELIVDRYDHRNFNCDLPEFAGKTTTSEVIAQQIWKVLNENLDAKLDRIKLHETARNIFEIQAED